MYDQPAERYFRNLARNVVFFGEPLRPASTEQAVAEVFDGCSTKALSRYFVSSSFSSIADAARTGLSMTAEDVADIHLLS